MNQMTDEDMLAQVQQGMGGQGGQMQGAGSGQQPPPGSGMKWEDVGADQQALSQDPSPLNVAAFVSYWGIEAMPPELMQGGGDQEMSEPNNAEGEY